jgi:membrane protein YqaA with SNARE-associated domain
LTDWAAWSVPIEPFATLAATPLVLLLLVAWGVGEAVVLPIVPDVLIGLLVLAAPGQTAPLLGAAVAGGVGGALIDWWLLRRHPALVARILMTQPALGRPGLDAAEQRLRDRGLGVGFSQVGPGLPLKAYLHALGAVAPDSGVRRVAALTFVNRVARLGPPALVFAALHPLAVGWPPLALAVAWTGGWTTFYLAYWIARDPRRG